MADPYGRIALRLHGSNPPHFNPADLADSYSSVPGRLSHGSIDAAIAMAKNDYRHSSPHGSVPEVFNSAIRHGFAARIGGANDRSQAFASAARGSCCSAARLR
jgi:hypothetical protein